jgi:predicted nucleotidyltransferase
MRLEHYSQKKLKKEILKIFGKHLNLDLYKIFFFGSRILDKGSERSDIDIGIDGPEEIPAKIMARLKEEIENLPILYKIEIVDFKKVSPEFREVALKKIEIIN